MRALCAVARHERLRPAELARHLRVAPRSVTDVPLTDAGRHLVAETDSARRADAEASFARLSERDRAALRRILTMLDQDG